jgi:hypothetical protein
MNWLNGVYSGIWGRAFIGADATLHCTLVGYFSLFECVTIVMFVK